MVKAAGRCKACGGKLIKEDGTHKCSLCGREQRTIPETYKFYEDNKTEILSDVSVMGKVAARKRWKIPEGSINKLLRRWQLQMEQKSQPAPGEATNGKYPELPSFKDNWAPEVQVKWLEVWGQRR